MNDNTVTNKQLFWLFLCMHIVLILLLTPSTTIKVAKQDAWLSAIIAIFISIFTMWTSIKVCSKYPSKDFNIIIEKILGKWIGRFFSILLLISFTIVLAAILRQYSEFISGTILPKTPVNVITFCILAVAIYPTFHGIGVVGRLAEIFGPIILLGVLIPIILGFGSLDFKHLLPLFEDSGALNIVKGSFNPAVFFSDCVMVVWLYNISENHTKRNNKFLIISILVSGVIYFISLIAIIATFGVVVASSQLYPFFMLERYISIFGIIENLDSIVITTWILSIFIKICLYLFVISYGFSKYTHKKSWKKLVFYFAIIVYILSLLPRNVYDASILFPNKIEVPYMLPLWTSLPLLLVIVNYIKGKFRGNKTGV